jgi:hypothetical protein
MAIPVYFYRTHTAKVTGSVTRRERCAGCSRIFEYPITRTVRGGGHSPFGLTDAGAAESAQMRGKAKLDRALKEAIEPHHCPFCGVFQPNMVQILRQQHGKHYDPNKYAAERLAVPWHEAWPAASRTNTIECYKRLKEVWPTYSDYADRKIRAIKYPQHIRKLVSLTSSVLFWIVWVAIIAFVIAVSWAWWNL